MPDRQHRDDLGVSDELLDAWEPQEPPDGFAQRVIEGMSGNDKGEERPSEPPLRASSARRFWVVAAIAAAVAVVAGASLLPHLATSWEPDSGRVIAEQRETVQLGSRGVAVVEAGSHLSWSVAADGTARIEQSVGVAFYRVEKANGRPFVVETPGGEVTVRGTSFHVEVEPMGQSIVRRNLVSAALGAAAAAAVVVTVYEGRVAFANEHGETELGPGEVSWAQLDGPPSEAVDVASLGSDGARRAGAVNGSGTADDSESDRGATPPQLRERLAALRAAAQEREEELESLRGRVRALESSPDGGVSDTDRLRSNPWYPPTPEDLETLVEQCGIRSDVPPVMGLEPGVAGVNAERMGLTEGEVPVVDASISRLHESFRERLRALYLEATGDEVGAQSLSADAMIAQISSAALPGEVQEAHRQVARERAGQAEPPASSDELTSVARAIRLHAGLGDEFQRLLAAELGEDRAHELRAESGGWPWGRSYSRACQ